MALYTVKPNPLWGWDPDLLVEIEVAEGSTSSRPAAQVLVDRVPVGFVFGRTDHTGRSKEWGHALGSRLPRLTERVSYPASTRLAAITSLVEDHLRQPKES